MLLLLILSDGIARVENNTQTTVGSYRQTEMVHKETLRASLIEVGARLPEEGIHTELKVELLRAELVRILRKCRLASVALALAMAWTLITTVWVVGAIAVVVVAPFVRKIAEELAGLGTNGVNAGGPYLDATVEGAGGSLKIDRIVVVITEKRHVVEIVDESEIPRVCGIDFL